MDEAILREIIAGVGDIPAEQVTMDADLAALGFDSLMALSIISRIEKRFKIQIPEQYLRGLKTPRQIMVLLSKVAASKPK